MYFTDRPETLCPEVFPQLRGAAYDAILNVGGLSAAELRDCEEGRTRNFANGETSQCSRSSALRDAFPALRTLKHCKKRSKHSFYDSARRKKLA